MQNCNQTKCFKVYIFPIFSSIGFFMFVRKFCLRRGLCELRLTERPDRDQRPLFNYEWFFPGLSNLRMVILGSISGSSAHEMPTLLSRVYDGEPPYPNKDTNFTKKNTKLSRLSKKSEC
ncbi:hypothetical protein CHARACLAT_002512 [Characodon lateralis]|uniref:Uncharacterized protein n=1 Tax=Characodon lateralis TaxID=208331 RepID=A0ABU7DX30_9TELE|nr:hypothetical protein [Characodon lateralis]